MKQEFKGNLLSPLPVALVGTLIGGRPNYCVIGYSFMFYYSYVVRPPLPVEAKIRFGRIDKVPHGMGSQSGIQFAAGIQVGIGWWWTERTSEP